MTGCRLRVVLNIAALAFLSVQAKGQVWTFSGSGTWASNAPNSKWTAPNSPWQFSVQLSLSPLPPAPGSGSPCCPPGATAFDVYFSNFSYSLNGSPVSTAPLLIGYYTASAGGGILLDDFDGLNNGFLLGIGTQLFSGPTTSPTLLTGTFPAGNARFDFPDGTHAFVSSGTFSITNAQPGPLSLTALAVTATDALGTPCGYGSPTCTYPYYWTSWGNYRLYLQTSTGSWINPGYGSGINVQLAPGDNVFKIFGDSNSGDPFHGVALYFNGHGGSGSTFNLCNGPADIMASAPTAASASSTPLNTSFSNSCLGTAGTTFTSGSTTVTLMDFRWEYANVENLDLVGPTNNLPNGVLDMVGTFTLHVATAPQNFSDGFEAATINPFWTSLVTGTDGGLVHLTNTIAHTGSQSIELDTSGTFAQSYLSHNFSSPIYGTAQVWVYDNTPYTGYKILMIYNGTDGPGTAYHIYLDWGEQQTHLYYPATSTTWANTVLLPAQTSKTWHLWTFTSAPSGVTIQIDGATVFTQAINFPFDTIRFSQQGGAGAAFFDDFSVRQSIVPTSVPAAINSSPSGASVLVSGTGCAPGTYTTPTNLTWSANTSCTLNFTNPQTISGTQYAYSSATINGLSTVENPLIVNSGSQPLAIGATFTSVGLPACRYSVSPTSQSFPFQGGRGSITVTTQPGCTWTYSIGASWIHYYPVPEPQIICNPPCPPPPFTYLVDPNPGSAQRTGNITIAGQTVTITEAGTSTCTYTLSPSQQTFTDSGGSGALQVLTATGCPWSVLNNASFVTITSGLSGSGNGFVSLSVGSNTGGQRSGSLTVGGKTFMISQNGSACGAIDVSDKVTVSQGPIEVAGLFDLYSRTVTVTNTTGQTIGPIYLVLDGLPNYSGFCSGPLAYGCSLASAPPGTQITHCPALVQSSTGSYVVPWLSQLGPHQSYPVQNYACGGLSEPACVGLTFISNGPFYGYTPMVLTGVPNQ